MPRGYGGAITSGKGTAMLESLIRTLPCHVYRAGEGSGGVRTLSAAGDHLTVTWHTRNCPHHVADSCSPPTPATTPAEPGRSTRQA
ncbi:hypothetical protein OHA84_36820 [Streptomyces sp. NBC_00513]|uniref:hypothetical protein n=1 Tax=unclassified Streptomyces TaxID=2593676 RepID=UPI002250E506|nr:hypothetical protein [Streptomyces sp. NBC_00424]MCX5078660.1 hypothetical protein [Streptomyces sp. NBC_00424]WUD39103.1 hypothetical protein OHA84_00480 [Streptomyces sp. NBC_00513]WUD45626.1 hypothetical protein OHA84_36820 [Streptomyces sp. NBC_00513]